MHTSYTLGHRTFVLDREKAEAALEAKRVVGGRETMTFNLLPLRYGWAYELYRTMKANHWEPEDVPMGKDIEQWRDTKLVSDVERWIIMKAPLTTGTTTGSSNAGSSTRHSIRAIQLIRFH